MVILSDRTQSIFNSMELEEKVNLLAGATLWTTVPIERLGIPAIKVTDGPNGARGNDFAGGKTAACFPVGVSLASTWNTQLVEQVGGALGQEAKTKGAVLLLAPTVNIHRSPLGGRNFESFSEDPYLTSRMAVAYIRGLQSQGVGATVKHFVCNDSEFERRSISTELDSRTLREIYLLPFEAAVTEAGSWALMSSYNKVNGVYASENAFTLKQILKQEWSYDGLVMSDWAGTYSTVEAAKNGLDLEMPGPPRWRGNRLLEAVKAGEVSEDAIDEAVKRILHLIDRAGAFESPSIQEEKSVDLPEHRRLARQAATEGIVLLKNEGAVLPILRESVRKIAVIGPNAKYAQIMGGGSSQVNPHYSVSPWEGILTKVGDRVELGYQIGCTIHKLLPPMDGSQLTPSHGQGVGWSVEYFNNLNLKGEIVAEGVVRTTEHAWSGRVAAGVDPEEFSARLRATFKPDESGRYQLGLSSAGLSRLYLDGKIILDNWGDQPLRETLLGMGSGEVRTTLELQAGNAYELILEYSRKGASLQAGFRLGCMPPVPEDSIQKAVDLAKTADVALVFVGLGYEWESEGYDRPDMELVGQQDDLVQAVAAANPHTIVVLQSGSPVSMPWIDQVAGILQAWYLGQECGNAIADVLFGDANPSGRLPHSYPVRLEDHPAYINYPGENGRVRYGEGLFVGYRYYEKKKITPLFPFGYGLSYTQYTYSQPQVSSQVFDPEHGMQVNVDVTNAGQRLGQEVVQLYVRDANASLVRPEKELKAFSKVLLQPGETRTVTLNLDLRSLAYYDDAREAWVAEAGEFEALVGSSSAHIQGKASFRLEQTVVIGGKEVGSAAPGLESPLKELLQDVRAVAVLEKHLPGFKDHPQLGLAMDFSLEQIAALAPEEFPAWKLEAIAADLTALA